MIKDRLQKQLISASQKFEEPEWFQNFRLKALKDIDHAPIPHFSKIHYQNWDLLNGQVTSSLDLEPTEFNKEIDLPEKNYLIIYGNNLLKANIDSDLIDKGLIVTDFKTALHDYPKLVKEYLNSAFKNSPSKFVNFNTAFMSNGLFVYVPKDLVINDVISVYCILPSDNNRTFAHRVLMIGDANSELNILENYIGSSKCVSLVEEFYLKDNAKLKFNAVDNFGINSDVYLKRQFELNTNADLSWINGSVSDSNVVNDFLVNLNGENSHADFKAVALSSKKQTQGFNTRINNLGLHTVGHILQRGVILDSSHLIFNGIGQIVKGARGSDAQQESRVLMLSKNGSGDANPILLIDENDVTAGHAASVGRINESQLYYLMSRGLSEYSAQKVVILGFLNDILSEIPLDSLRQSLNNLIERKLKIG